MVAMVQGAFFATIGLFLGAMWHLLYMPEVSLFAVPVIWVFTLIFTLPVMMLPALPLPPILRLIYRRVQGGWFLALAVLAALPFVMLLLAAVWALPGSPEILWNLDGILRVARMVLGTSLGLGLGCAEAVLLDIRRGKAYVTLARIGGG